MSKSKKFEGSKEDKKMDAKGQKKMGKAAKKKGK